MSQPAALSLDIVVPVYNEQATLATSLRRLHAYLTDTMQVSWRITVADNASTDETPPSRTPSPPSSAESWPSTSR